MTKKEEKVEQDQQITERLKEFNQEFARMGFDESTADIPVQNPKTIIINGKKVVI